jgi:hypothetical protein
VLGFLGLLLVLGACSAEGAVVEHLESVGGHIFLNRVEVEGTGGLRFLLDTGAQSSAITPTAAARLRLVPRYQVEAVTAAGTRTVPAARAAGAGVPGAMAADVELMIDDLPGIPSDAGRVDGVLGQNFLTHFNYLLDYRHARILFEPGSLTKGRDGRGGAIPFELVDGRTVVPVGGLSRRAWRLVLDTGTSHLVLFREFHGATNGRSVLNTVIGSVTVRTATVALIEIGGTAVGPVTAAIVPRDAGRSEDGLLPGRLFHAIYINNREKYLVLNPAGV